MEDLKDDIMISVALITYGQEKYVKQALDSILMQETKYKYEIIIGDDCSKDNTREILLEYQKKFNNKISLILQEKNVGATRNIFDLFKKCSGKYITLFEGDDYWIDSKKIQKQVEFLENHYEYLGVSHTFNLVDVNGKFISKYPDRINTEKFVTINSFLKGDFFRITTTVFRNIFTGSENKYDVLYRASRNVGDFTLSIILLDLGKIYVLDDCMSVYRVVNKKGENNYNSITTPLKNYNDFIQLIKIVDKHYNNKYDFSHDYIMRSISALKISITSKKIKEFINTFKDIPIKCQIKVFFYMPIYTLKLLIKKLSN